MNANEIRIGQTVIDHNREDWITQIQEINCDGRGQVVVRLKDSKGRTGLAYPKNLSETDQGMPVVVTAAQRRALYELMERPGSGIRSTRMYNTLLRKGLIANTTERGIHLTAEGRKVFA